MNRQPPTAALPMEFAPKKKVSGYKDITVIGGIEMLAASVDEFPVF